MEPRKRRPFQDLNLQDLNGNKRVKIQETSRKKITERQEDNGFIRQESQGDIREDMIPPGDLHTGNQLDFLRGRNTHGDHDVAHGHHDVAYGDYSGENPLVFDLLRENQNLFRGDGIRGNSIRGNSIARAMAEQKADYIPKLWDVRERKSKLDDPSKKVSIEEIKPSLITSEGYTYERTTQAYIDSLGTHTLETTIKVKKDDSDPVEITTKYSGEAFAIARQCCLKMDGFIQNNYHDALEQAKLKIEEEMVPKYAELGAAPDPEARANLDAERNNKIAEAEKKAGASRRKFLDKYGGRHMDAELLEELQWVQGMEAAVRDVKGRIAGSEDRLNTSAEELQKITTDINDKIQEIKRMIPSSSATPAESHALAGSSNTSSPEAAPHSHDTLTLENFDKKIKDYMSDTGRELSDAIYKQITSLSTDESTYPENVGLEDRLKIRKALLDIALQLVKRRYKLDEPIDMLEKWERYSATHYGKRLMYERQLVDHLETIAKAAGEHATALHQESELVKEVDRYYRAAGKANLHPTSSGPHSAEFESTLEKLQDETTDQTERNRHFRNLVNLYPQIRDTLKSNSLQISLEKLETAHLYTAETHGKLEEAKELKGKIEKLVELEKGRDDASDALDLKKVDAIKETDKTTLQHARTLELEMVKHFYARKLEDQKALNKEEEEIRQYLINLDKAYVAHKIQQKRLITMYWLALFGAGDQAGLVAMRTETSSEFNSLMGLFR
jgi:hypothetical protein